MPQRVQVRKPVLTCVPVTVLTLYGTCTGAVQLYRINTALKKIKVAKGEQQQNPLPTPTKKNVHNNYYFATTNHNDKSQQLNKERKQTKHLHARK